MNQPQTKSLRQKLKPMLPYLSLSLILLVIIFLWFNLPEEHFRSTYSNSGTWDLREFDFEDSTAALFGRVEAINTPFLTPEEFAARELEARFAYPHIPSNPATVRVRLLLPTDDYYVITRINTGYADRVYVNGEWLRDISNPDDGTGAVLFSPTFTFVARPINGVIEIVHQQSNFMYHIHGIYRGCLLDAYTIGNDIQRVTLTTNIILGILLSLAVVSLLLFLLLHNYRPALLFTLLCSGWFLHVGAMGSRAFITIAPWFAEPLRFRLMSIVTPVTPVLVVPIIYDMFPGILPKKYVSGMVFIFSAWIIFFQFADIGLILSHALWICMGMALVGVMYGVVALIIKVRKPDGLQLIFIAGVLFLAYTSVRDIFNYLTVNVEGFNFLIPPFGESNFARIGMIAFLLCLAASIFIATTREMEAVKVNEQKSETARQQLATENAALDSLNRMKAQYLANISHNIKTPLTAISVDIQKAARLVNKIKIENGELVIDNRITASLNRAQEEIMHAARLTESALRMAAMQESRDKMKPLDTEQLFVNNAEAYRSHVEKQGNVLKIDTDKNLPQIFGNADQLMGVLTNLLTNANRHTTNGEITVRIEHEDERYEGNNSQFVTVTVKDSGTGVPPEILPYIFERGVTGTDSTGMGLAISKKTIETHGGEISVKSESGMGTEVTFTIPVYIIEH
ncbi:MAG: HAMP domain-containing histidine kinase [Oscillospiraceae bacterium]|nr:HAMP domain-containing histidine kinase [Oscillospiraceae bacterium]